MTTRGLPAIAILAAHDRLIDDLQELARAANDTDSFVLFRICNLHCDAREVLARFIQTKQHAQALA